jgi:hypothetical protein
MNPNGHNKRNSLHLIRVYACAFVVLCSAVSIPAQSTTASSRPGGEITPPPRRDVPGQRIKLLTGDLFIPDFFHADPTQRADLVVWFLGAPWCAQQVFYQANKNAALLVIDTRVLQRGFQDPASWRLVLNEAANALKTAEAARAGVGKIVLVSFSGGWTGVRSVLSRDELAAAVSDVVLLDSLYARDRSTNQIDQTSIEPFLRFARRACESGDARFIFTHLYPPLEEHRGNTTTVCASHLIDELKLERTLATGANSRGAKLLYRAVRNNCHILGYAGMTNQDHFEHFYSAADAIKLTNLADAPKPPESHKN